MHHCMSISRQPMLDKICSVLEFIDADLIGLQEVDMGAARSGFKKQAALIAQRLNMGYVFGETLRFRQGSYGIAVLSRYPIKKVKNLNLPGNEEPRLCQIIDINIQQQTLHFINLHMGLNHTTRLANMQQLILPCLQNLPHPIIMVGDFNASPDEKPVLMLSDFLQDTFAYNSGIINYTYPANNPQYRIDYIFVDRCYRVDDFYIIAADASDHLPVVANIEI
ncbi:endonuclease/exonuclease/phosphatase family protein [Syntrophomonas erecta]